MARHVNSITLLGNVGADPEVRSTSNGSKVVTIGVATSRSWKDAGGSWQEKTQWHRVVAWENPGKGPRHATTAEQIKKGDRVFIEGSIEYRSWADREGQTRYTTEVNARTLIPLGRGEKKPDAAAGAKREQSFEDFPEALDAEDDDLPF